MNRSVKVVLALLALVLLLGLTMPAVAEDKGANGDQTEGKIKSMDVNKSEFVLTDRKDKNWTMYLDTKAKVVIDGKDARFADLKVDDHVMVTYLKQGTKLVAEKITAKRTNK
jgi:hypothetical protein